MPIRSQVGRPDGVTNASISPDTASTTISPSAIVMVARPSVGERIRPTARPGSTTVQPSRSPAPDATKTAVSSSMPCGRISPKNSAGLAGGDHVAAVDADVQHVREQQDHDGRDAEQRPRTINVTAATHTLLVHTWVAKSCAGADW